MSMKSLSVKGLKGKTSEIVWNYPWNQVLNGLHVLRVYLRSPAKALLYADEAARDSSEVLITLR